MYTSKKLLIIAALLASTAVCAEQTRGLDGQMIHVYSGTAAESAMIYRASAIAARSHVTERKFRLDRLQSKLSLF